MPAKQGRVVVQSLLEAAKKVLDNMPGGFDVNDSTKINGQDQMRQVSRWYSSLKLSCPFLSDGLCTAYEQRPISCREHVVTGSALLCEDKFKYESRVVPMPVSIVESLGQMTAELEQSDIEAVMLPVALPWSEENPERDEQRWPAVQMVEKFVEIVETMAAENSAAAVG
jgi:Fe-S-cluster containining protein